jgi:hypothetical protein
MEALRDTSRMKKIGRQNVKMIGGFSIQTPLQRGSLDHTESNSLETLFYAL